MIKKKKMNILYMSYSIKFKMLIHNILASVFVPVMLSYVLKFISMWSHWKTRQLSVLGAAIVTYTSFLKLNVSTDNDSDARD